MSGTKGLGCGLIAAGVLWLLGVGAFFLSGVPAGRTDLPAAILGTLMFGLPLMLVTGVAGALIYLRGRRDAEQMAETTFERNVLDMIEMRGTAKLRDIAADLGRNEVEVEEALRALVGKRLFTGFINWKQGIAYSEAAADLDSGKCPNCGGKLDLAGKDLAVCPYCGTEIFLNRA